MEKKILTFKTKIALATAILFWSSAFVGIRIGLTSYSPGGLALLRFLVASICMGIIYKFLPHRAILSRKDLILLILFGALGLGCYNVFLNYGEISVSAGIASFIISQSPLLTLLCSIIFLQEKFNLGILVGILVSILGVGLITLGHHEHTLQLNLGLIYLFLAALVSGLYSILQKPFLNKYPIVDVTVFIVWGATLFLLIYTPNLIADIKTASLSATLAGIYLGIFPAAIAAVAWSYALAHMPASLCATFLYFMPVFATVLGWFCLGEVPALLSLLGGVIALLGVWVANKAFLKG